MNSNSIATRSELRKALGGTRPPERITQDAFERDEGHLGRMVRLEANARPTPDDLFDYLQDLRYTEIQTSLFVYLLPVLLQAWRNDVLRIDASNAGTIENFYPVLAQRGIFTEHLTAKQTAVVGEFMRRTILEEIDEQRGLQFRGSGVRAYRWIREVMTYGVLLPDVEVLWREWWSARTVGRAVAAIQFISCLMYSDYENPVFAPWTGDEGGGPPSLWEFEGHLFENRWLEPNVKFLAATLNVESVKQLLLQAVDRLRGEAEHSVATSVIEDFALCEETIATRCDALPKPLATRQTAGNRFEWPE